MDSMCGCSTDQQIYRLVDPGGSVTFDWAGTYYEQLTLTEQCAPSGGGGPCLAEKAVPAGEVTLTLHVLTNADVPDNPSCDDGVCITWDHSLGGQEETVPTTLTFNAAGAQTHTVTVD